MIEEIDFPNKRILVEKWDYVSSQGTETSGVTITELLKSPCQLEWEEHNIISFRDHEIPLILEAIRKIFDFRVRKVIG